MRVKGLPIGFGELWHDPVQRFAMLLLVSLALAPLVGWILPACDLMLPGTYRDTVVPPVLGLLAVFAVGSSLRWPALATRVGVGVVVGLLGGIAYDLSLDVAHWLVLTLGLPLPHTDLLESLATGAGSWSERLSPWLGAAAAWGLAYAILTGKARWYFGLVWGGMLWSVLTLMALLLPKGGIIEADTGPLALACLLVVHLAFGATIGALNYLLQPEPRGRAKILFLRDYVSKIKQR